MVSAEDNFSQQRKYSFQIRAGCASMSLLVDMTHDYLRTMIPKGTPAGDPKVKENLSYIYALNSSEFYLQDK